jgi:ABC-2 type transport system ATP-binding protein
MLEIKNIVKQYEAHLALDDVSMHIPKGSVFGLLGPNGAGKTSLIRIINQITAADSGEILFNSEKLNPSHISKIGYLPEERGLYKKMEIGEQVLYLSQLKGLTKAEATKRAKYWFEKMEIQSWWTKKVEELSKGMQQKVQFIATVIHEPELLILDEPFSGFDPVNAEIIKDEFLELNKKGCTIIFSSHRMESVEQLCDRIALINKSKKILEGTVEEIQNQYKDNSYSLSVSGTYEQSNFESPNIQIISLEHSKGNTIVKLKSDDHESKKSLLNKMINQYELISFEEIIPSIHDIFIQNVTRK